MPTTIIEAFPREVKTVRAWEEDNPAILKVAECFADTVQGENSVGIPSVFLRLQGCTLNCSWCDTEEVWRKGNPYNVTELLDLWNIKWLVDDTRTDTPEEASNARSIVDRLREGHHLILTGGSPLKQQDGLIALISEFQTRFGFKPYIEIENECTLVPKDEIVAIVDLWNNSPKLANNGMKRLVRYKPGIIRYLSTLNSHFKFVISEAADWDEIVKDFIEPGLIKKHQIVLMPEGATREDLHKNYQKVVDIAVREDLRMTDRLHVTIWDKATGV